MILHLITNSLCVLNYCDLIFMSQLLFAKYRNIRYLKDLYNYSNVVCVDPNGGVYIYKKHFKKEQKVGMLLQKEQIQEE